MLAVNWEITALNDLQKKAVKAIVDGNDVFVCLPTGFGKSLFSERAVCVGLPSFRSQCRVGSRPSPGSRGRANRCDYARTSRQAVC